MDCRIEAGMTKIAGTDLGWPLEGASRLGSPFLGFGARLRGGDSRKLLSCQEGRRQGQCIGAYDS